MKLYNKLFQLLWITPILTYTIIENVDSMIKEYSLFNNKIQVRISKRGEEDKELKKLLDDCSNTINELEKCMMKSDIEVVNLNNFCSNYYSDECFVFLNNGTKSIPACQDDRVQEKLGHFNVLVELVNFYKKYHCAKDEDGNYCPFSLMDSENRRILKIDNSTVKVVEQYEKEFYTNVENTCRSEKCTETYIDYSEENNRIKTLVNQTLSSSEHSDSKSKRYFFIENFNEIDNDELNNLAIEYLKSDECKKMKEESQKKMQVKEENNNKEIDESTDDYSNNANINTINIIATFVILNVLMLFI